MSYISSDAGSSIMYRFNGEIDEAEDVRWSMNVSNSLLQYYLSSWDSVTLPLDGLRDILNVGDITHITFNGDTYEYLYYITSLVLQTVQDKLSIYRCNDGRQVPDDSEEWKKLDLNGSLQEGIHLVECSDGSPELFFSDWLEV